MSEELDLSPANELRKQVYKLVVRGERKEAAARVYEHLRVLQEDPSASEVDCKDGCAYCCALPVMLSVAEAELIANHIDQSPRREELVERLSRDHAANFGLSANEIAARRLPCSLLDGPVSNGTCSVYEVRPLACRSFTSYDVDLCKRIYAKPSEEPTSPARPIDYLTQMMAQSGLAGPMQKAFELRALLLELLTKRKRKELEPATIDVTFRPDRAR